MPICFSPIVKHAMFAYVNYARIRSWNQPILSNKGKASCSRKQLGFTLTTGRHPLITSQSYYLLHHTAPAYILIKRRIHQIQLNEVQI